MNAQTIRHIHFRHPFQLPGMDAPQEPGSFDLIIEKIPLDVSWEAYRTSCTLMLFRGTTTSAYTVSLAEIDAALLRDQQHDINTGCS